ncbi:MAG: GAF domain-containing protein [Deltaproteobacteria bacterium]
MDRLPPGSSEAARAARYAELREELALSLAGESDWIAILSTSASALHVAFGYFDWTGFYRVIGAELLGVGPYQGGHGCLRIPFQRGVCGAAARTLRTQFVPDVQAFPDHIACSSLTQSEIVVPVLTPGGRLLAVLDVDSNLPAAFSATDQRELEALCRDLGRRYAPETA